ncbi:M20/M25/M40 family metallo-hydrolase [Phytohabitans rumicis]|uniref:Glutamate carboxypeptidase n=1 Tax=Phytohabitans rumicis TaxID=1076125 RepID=A0A6V8LDV3_9ACTN|nr:M20/M25/M40 family metallo-hydrolase [Phytohabitans rumicis]GFJ93820.1 glutamate carboxypeptidase [Phytohabitans rumicis]
MTLDVPIRRLGDLRSRTAEMVRYLDRLVSVETPSEDLAACRAGADVVGAVGEEIMGDQAEPVEVDGRVHLRWSWPAGPDRPTIGLIGHYDTVWPMGTLDRWPFTLDQTAGTATGPGCFDMKAGIVQLFHAIAALPDRAGLEVLLTCDEELGSPTSQELVRELARRAAAALILEPSAGGALKTSRKGIGRYRFDVHGRAAHAGLEPENGRNALTVLGKLLLDVGAMARPDVGTTVTPTLAAGGTASNVVPAHAWLQVDVRVAVEGEAERVDDQMRGLAPGMPDVTLALTGGPNRPPMPATSSAALFARATAAAAVLGVGPLAGVAVGGGSDGNFTAAAGCPTLDGLGAVGAGAHAEGEYVVIAGMPERAALVTELIQDIRGGR